MAHHDLLTNETSRRYKGTFGPDNIRYYTHQAAEYAKPIAQSFYAAKPFIDAAVIAGLPITFGYNLYQDYTQKEKDRQDELNRLKFITDKENFKKIFTHETETLDRLHKQEQEENEMKRRGALLKTEAGQKIVPTRSEQQKSQTTLEELLELRRIRNQAANTSKTIIGPTSTSTATTTTTTTTTGVEEVGSTLGPFPDYSSVKTRGYDYTKAKGNRMFKNAIARTVIDAVDKYGSMDKFMNSPEYETLIKGRSYGQRTAIDDVVNMLTDPSRLQNAINLDQVIPQPIIERFLPDKLSQMIPPDKQEKFGFSDEIESQIAAENPDLEEESSDDE